MPPFNYRFDGIFRPQVVAAALMIALVTALLSGIPTDVISNPWFTRMTPVSAADRALLVASSLLVGIALVPIKDSSIARQPSIRKLGIGGGIASWLAIGCAVCNKLIVALIGVSGAAAG